MTGEKHEVCNECGRSVSYGSGRFIDRVPDLNTFETRVSMGKIYPQGDFLCKECDEHIKLSDYAGLLLLTTDELDMLKFGLGSIACGDASFCEKTTTGGYENCTKCSQLQNKLDRMRV